MDTHVFIILLRIFIGLTCAHCMTDSHCPAIKSSAEILSRYGLVKHLTDPCRYSFVRPPGSLNISTRVHIYNSQANRNLRYYLHLLLQLRYLDPRLAYKSTAPGFLEITGGEELQDMIWTPHIYLVNDQKSVIMGSLNKDIFVSIYPDGTVIFAQRLKTVLTCWMKLHKFPFDEQHCSLMLGSWVYDSNELILQWEDDIPVSMPPNLHMSEYYISNMWTNTSNDSEHGQFYGSYSALTVTFVLSRQVEFYIMDYYLPSTLLVCISWVSFWLDANALSGRISLGISTMLTFIALSSKTGSAMPKVSYIMASEVWFVVCTAFIIGSLVEFAFVNNIWRRRKNIELKKVSSKYILKSTLTPKLARKELGQQKTAVQRSASSPQFSTRKIQPPLLVTQASSSSLDIPRIVDFQDEEEYPQDNNSVMLTPEEENSSFTTMTPQQIAKWIDTKSRLMFPVTFFTFNLLYWGFVFLDFVLTKSGGRN